MFPQQPQQQFRNAGADVQFFYTESNWNKPTGISNVYMMLIGPGGNGTALVGGGSGAVTVWYGSAQNVPDNLRVVPGRSSGSNSTIRYRGSSDTNLLTANSGSSTTGGTAMTANQFAASGFFQSVAGQNGLQGAVSASATTFLSGGAGAGVTVTGNYGYVTNSNESGKFQLQPIIVGTGAAGEETGKTFNGGIGCGGPRVGSNGGAGGQGMILIASW